MKPFKELKTITVKDVIKDLKKLPPDMEVWTYWDEGGEYGRAVFSQVSVHRVVFKKPEYSKRRRWEESERKGYGKEVCCLMENTMDSINYYKSIQEAKNKKEKQK